MGKSLDDLYQDLLDLDSPPPGYGPVFGTGLQSLSALIHDEDAEEFETSQEIVKQQQLEQAEGKRPGRGNRGGQPGPIEEEAHFHRYTTRRQHKYTETEMIQIRESCMTTIVHDYGERDIYHLSDEERAENDMLAEIRDRLQTLKRTYRKPDQYVEAMRIVMDAWNILERSNYLHTREEFFEMVADGRIYSNSIIMPKLKKMDNYNFDMIVKLISNPDADASILAVKPQQDEDDEFYLFDDPVYQMYYDEYLASLTDEEKDEMDASEKAEKADQYARDKIDEEETYRLLSPEEAQFVVEYADNPPEIKVKDMPVKYIRGYDQKTFGKKKKKKGSKFDRYAAKNLHVLLNKIQSNYGRRTLGSGYDPSALITASMFEPEKEFKSFWDRMHFDGSWANPNEVFLYDLAIQEEVLKQHPPGQRYLTYSDQEMDRFFRTLEEAGISTLELRRMMNMAAGDSVSDSVTIAAKKKENKKLEAAIISRITRLNKSPKFKKLVVKAEKNVNEDLEDM